MRSDRTDITILIDRSGSMSPIAADMVGGLTTFIEEQRKLPGECTVSLWQFDDQIEHVFCKSITEVGGIGLDPRGSTALNDAWGRAMVHTGRRLDAIPEADRPEHVIFVVITDGQENASREWTIEKVRQMVKEQTEKYNWTFVYLAANQDAVTVGGGYGVAGSNASNFAANSRSVGGTYAGLSNSVASVRAGNDWQRVEDTDTIAAS